MDHRRCAMRGKTKTILKERPVWEGTSSLIGLVNTVSATAANSPTTPTGISPLGEKREDLEAGIGGLTVDTRRVSDEHDAKPTSPTT
jgi:hypothetical protein